MVYFLLVLSFFDKQEIVSLMIFVITFTPKIVTFSLNVHRVADLNFNLVPVPGNEFVEAPMSGHQACHVSVLSSANYYEQPKHCVENTRSAGVNVI